MRSIAMTACRWGDGWSAAISIASPCTRQQADGFRKGSTHPTDSIGASTSSARGKPRQFEAERAQAFAGGLVIGLRIGSCFIHAVEEKPALIGDVIAGHEMQDRVAALLDGRDRRDP